MPGVKAVCLRCFHETQSYGQEARGVRRCLALMREECPCDERNFYVSDSGEEDDTSFSREETFGRKDDDGIEWV